MVKYPFDPNGSYEVDRIISPQHINGELKEGEVVEFVDLGHIIVDRSGKFDINPEVGVMRPRGFYLEVRSFPDLILNPNRKIVISGSFREGAQQFTFDVDTTWGTTDSLSFHGQ